MDVVTTVRDYDMPPAWNERRNGIVELEPDLLFLGNWPAGRPLARIARPPVGQHD